MISDALINYGQYYETKIEKFVKIQVKRKLANAKIQYFSIYYLFLTLYST